VPDEYYLLISNSRPSFHREIIAVDWKQMTQLM